MQKTSNNPIFKKPEIIPDTLTDFGYDEKEAPNNKAIEKCIYCQGRDIVKRGTRKKKLEIVQLYKCKSCSKTFMTKRFFY